MIRMRRALKDSRFDWRTVDRLADIAGVSRDLALDLLRAPPDIELGNGRSGGIIARLHVGDNAQLRRYLRKDLVSLRRLT
jgi:hypothetical protein